MTTAKTLLSEIQTTVGCPYLSDLYMNSQLLNKKAKLLILAIPLERYSLQEWNDAASYITGKKCNYQSI